MQFTWSFCPECQRVTQFALEESEESCIECGSIFEIEKQNLQQELLVETSLIL